MTAIDDKKRKVFVIIGLIGCVFFSAKTAYHYLKLRGIRAEREALEFASQHKNRIIGTKAEEAELTLPFEGWNIWEPWSKWPPEDVVNGNARALIRVDMGDPSLDFTAFRKLYLGSSIANRLDCLSDIMHYDMSHGSLSDERRSMIRETFTELLTRDIQFLPELIAQLGPSLRIKGIILGMPHRLLNSVEVDLPPPPEGGRRANHLLCHRRLPVNPCGRHYRH